jgi:hypothetical protein
MYLYKPVKTVMPDLQAFLCTEMSGFLMRIIIGLVDAGHGIGRW